MTGPYLIAASEAIKLPDEANARQGHLEFFGNVLIVIQDNGDSITEFVVQDETDPVPARRSGAIRFDRAIGLSHYAGWSDSFRLTDLENIRPDNQRANRYWAGAHELLFPA